MAAKLLENQASRKLYRNCQQCKFTSYLRHTVHQIQIQGFSFGNHRYGQKNNSKFKTEVKHIQDKNVTLRGHAADPPVAVVTVCRHSRHFFTVMNNMFHVLL